MLGFRFWADLLMILGGFKLVLMYLGMGELRLTNVLGDFEELKLFVLWLFVVRISNWVFLET